MSKIKLKALAKDAHNAQVIWLSVLNCSLHFYREETLKMNKTRLNYALDALIGVAFVLSTLTGMVFMAGGSGGYQGGVNESFRTTIFGISRWVWSDLHVLTSFVMIGGVLLHVALHWKWIACVTKRMISDVKPGKKDEACPVIQQ